MLMLSCLDGDWKVNSANEAAIWDFQIVKNAAIFSQSWGCGPITRDNHVSGAQINNDVLGIYSCQFQVNHYTFRRSVEIIQRLPVGELWEDGIVIVIDVVIDDELDVRFNVSF